MKLIVGLGNPGPQYDKTRHNAGFMVVDRLLRRHAGGATPKGRFNAVVAEASVSGEKTLFMKPTTFMNLSGRAVGEAVGFYKIDPPNDLLVIVDDVALPTGQIRLRASGGPGGHNGLTDIQRALGSDNYPRLRVGVDACPPYMALEDYVLGRFSPEQSAQLEPALDQAADAAEMFVARGVTAAMNRFNSKPAAGAPSPRPAAPGATTSPTPEGPAGHTGPAKSSQSTPTTTPPTTTTPQG